MTILNTVVSTGGGQGGGDKVTALVGSNASGVDVGDKVILNTDLDVDYDTTGLNIGYPLYFDGSYLYASGGVYSASSGVLTRTGNLGSTLSAASRFIPPCILPDGTVMFGASSGTGSAPCVFLKDGLVMGAFDDSRNAYFVDSRLDSTKTGFVIASYATTGSYFYCNVYYLSQGARVADFQNTTMVPFMDSSNNAYTVRISDGRITRWEYSNGSISGTNLFSSASLVSFISGVSSLGYTACTASREDNFQFWYRGGDRVHGFVNMDIAHSSVTVLSMPEAMQYINGTLYCAWWDLQNRLNVRTSTGLYVFSYSNHDISTLQLVKSFTWTTDYSGPATCSPDLKSYAVGNTSCVKVVTQTAMPIYEFSANVYNGHNFADTSLTGFVNEAPTTDPYGQSIVEVNTVKDPADTWTNVGIPFGFPVSTTSANVSVGAGYYNSGSSEIIMPSAVTKTLSQASSGQTTGYKNDVVAYKDTSDNNSALICKTGTTPVGTFKASTALSTNVYLNDDKSVIAGTNADSGFGVSYETETQQETGYTVAGSPSITSAGVASGFTTSDYIVEDNIYLGYGVASSFELNIAFSIPSAVGDQSHLLISADTTSELYYSYGGILLYVRDNSGENKLRLGLYSDEYNAILSPTWSNTTILPNTKYYVKITFNGSEYKLRLSTDGITYTDEISVASSTKVLQSVVWNIGGARGRSVPFTGSIYLADTNLTVNGNLVWKAFTPATDGSVTVSDGYKYIDEVDPPFCLDSDLTQSASQMVVHSEDFVEQTVYIPQFEIVGSPTIADRVASGFSDSNYLTCANYLNSASQSFELVTAVNMSTASTGILGIFDTQGTSTHNIRLTTSSTNTARLRMSTSGGETYAVDITGTTPLTVGTKVYIKATYSSSTGYALYTSTDGSTWTTEGTSSTTTRPYASANANLMIGDNAATGFSLSGFIYIADSYIEVNGSRVWSGYEVLTAKQGTLFLTKPTATSTSSVIVANTAAVPATNNYTLIGSPTITDGVASGFGTSDYLVSQQNALIAYGDSWEFNIAFMLTSAYSESNYGYIVGNYNGYSCIKIYPYGSGGEQRYLVELCQGAYGTQCWTFGSVMGNTRLSLNTKYYLKLIYIHSNTASERIFKLKISTDGVNYVEDDTGITYTWNYAPSQNRALAIGGSPSDASSRYFGKGNIYLADTNLYINGQLSWQAMTPAQPSEPVDTSKEYCGSVVDPINKGKVVTMDTTLTKILSVDNA